MKAFEEDVRSPSFSAPTQAFPTSPKLQVRWAQTPEEVLQAQRLRYEVFVEEMGASPEAPPGTPAGHEADLFDPYCEHLLVTATTGDEELPLVVGTYRVLTPQAASVVGGLYTDQEFDLVRLHRLRPRMAELGRSCVHPQWRCGSVMLILWGQLMGFMQRNGLEFMVGCVSVGMRDGGHVAASLWRNLRQTALASEDRLVSPRLPLPLQSLRSDLKPQVPALMRGYLNCGAKVLGPPAWDPAFSTADFPMMLALADMPAHYRRRLGRA